jgi:hypothetical protein
VRADWTVSGGTVAGTISTADGDSSAPTAA